MLVERVEMPAKSSPVAELTPVSRAARVVCCLDAELLARVQRVVPVYRSVSDAAALLRLVEESDSHLVIADPMIDSGVCADALVALRAERRSVLVAAYTRFQAAVVPQLLRLGAAGVTDAVLFNVDDQPERFAGFLARAAAHPYSQAMLAALEGHIHRLPVELGVAIHQLYNTPVRFRGCVDLATAAGLTRTTMYSRLAEAGFPSGRLLVGSGRVVRAVAMLQDRATTVAAVAERLRYHRPEQLSAAVQELVGDQPRNLRQIHPTVLAQRVFPDESSFRRGSQWAVRRCTMVCEHRYEQHEPIGSRSGRRDQLSHLGAVRPPTHHPRTRR